MEEAFVKRLLNVDRELHILIDELKSKQSKKPRKSLFKIRELLSSNSKSDKDPTELIRQMRDKEY